MPHKHPSGIRSLTPSPFPKQAATIPIKQSTAPALEHASNTENLAIRAENLMAADESCNSQINHAAIVNASAGNNSATEKNLSAIQLPSLRGHHYGGGEFHTRHNQTAHTPR